MKRFIVGVLALAAGMAGVFVYTGVTREREYRRLASTGDEALAADQTVLAIEAFSGAIALRSDSMLAYLKRGETYRRRGDLVSALRDLRTAARLDPVATRPLEQLGDVNYALRDYARAADRYDAYVQLDDRSSTVFYRLALARYRMGLVAAAIPPLRQALSVDDQFAEAYYLLGLCLREQQQSEAALEALHVAVDLAPELIPAREALADLHASLGQTSREIEQLEALDALDAGRPDRSIELGLAYARAGQTELAVLTLGRTAEQHPDPPRVYAALGRVWLNIAEQRGDRVALGKALEALQSLVGTRATSEARTLHARALLLAGDYELARRVLVQATDRFPVDPSAYRLLADLAELEGDFATARDAFSKYQLLSGDLNNAQLLVSNAGF